MLAAAAAVVIPQYGACGGLISPGGCAGPTCPGGCNRTTCRVQNFRLVSFTAQPAMSRALAIAALSVAAWFNVLHTAQLRADDHVSCQFRLQDAPWPNASCMPPARCYRGEALSSSLFVRRNVAVLTRLWPALRGRSTC